MLWHKSKVKIGRKMCIWLFICYEITVYVFTLFKVIAIQECTESSEKVLFGKHSSKLELAPSQIKKVGHIEGYQYI